MISKKLISLIIKQKSESQNGFFKKTKHAKFLKTSVCVCVCVCVCMYQGVRNVCFSENLACFVVLKHPFWHSPFWFISVDIILSHECFFQKVVTTAFLKTSAEQSRWTKIYWVKKWQNIWIPQLLLSRMLSIIFRSVFCRIFQQVLW